jgi:hypothetical protein
MTRDYDREDFREDWSPSWSSEDERDYDDADENDGGPEDEDCSGFGGSSRPIRGEYWSFE